SGEADCIMAGGTESMTLVPMMGHKVVGSRAVMDSHPEFYLGMGITAENVADEYKISRADQDKFAYESHMKASNAIEKGLFKNEICEIPVTFRSPGPGGDVKIDHQVMTTDEGPRPDTTVEALGKLRAVFKNGGSV